ncbi:MAG: DUF4375 domain-containing protein [Longibaculum sp.]
MATYEDALDNVTLKASEIIARSDTSQIVSDLFEIISEKCEDGYSLNELNGIERVFFLCCNFDSQMNVGGIDRFYHNESGNYANETVEALVEIGANHTALILDKGNGIFKEGVVPEDMQARIEEIDNLDFKECAWLFDELDREYMEHNDDLEKLCLHYVLTNKEAFM